MNNIVRIFDEHHLPSHEEEKAIVDFLFENLQEYGDPKKEIQQAVDYSLKKSPSFGGLIITIEDQQQIKGAVVINKTGMGGYIPENILVYIATHNKFRGQGIGKTLMQNIINKTQGDIALHVEANNPAIKLYEKYGFTNPYLEMRFKRK